MTDIYVLCTGQEDNIGDVVLRRAFLDELREIGRLGIYLGPASAEFIDALALGPDDRVFDSKKDWRAAAWRSARAQRTWIVDKPGEIVLNRRLLAAQVRLWPLMVLARLRGGRVIRSGLGFRTDTRWKQRLYAQTLRASDMLVWRDTESRQVAGHGRVAPDWGFWEDCTASPHERDSLILSYRSDRPMPSEDALEAVRRFADREGLRLVVATQVQRDSSRTLEIAAVIGADVADWPLGVSHRDQEQRLRELYGRARLVLSDRLHVLIVGYTEGALPLCLVEWDEDKINRHFAPVGMADVSVRAVGAEWFDVLSSSVEGAGPGDPRLQASALDDVRRELRQLA